MGSLQPLGPTSSSPAQTQAPNADAGQNSSSPSKGKGKEQQHLTSPPLVWADVYEALGGCDLKRTLAFTPHNVIVASLPIASSSPSSSITTVIGSLPSPVPLPHLRAWPLPPSESSSSTPSFSFPLPLPRLPLPHLSPTYLSASPSGAHLVAFFPLEGPPGQGGTLALWEILSNNSGGSGAAGGGRTRADWIVRDQWAVAAGREVIDVAWLGSEREWAAAPLPPSKKEEDVGASKTEQKEEKEPAKVVEDDDDGLFTPKVEEPSFEFSTATDAGAGSTSTSTRQQPPKKSSPPGPHVPPKLHRLPALGPPLPTRASSASTPPTFLVLAASHELVLYHPAPPTPATGTIPAAAVSSSSSSNMILGVGWPLRVLRCGFAGPEVGVWGIDEAAQVVGHVGGSEGAVDAAVKRDRRVRRGKIHLRAEDSCLYVATHSADLPRDPPAPILASTIVPPAVTTSSSSSDPNALFHSLGLGGDLSAFTVGGEEPIQLLTLPEETAEMTELTPPVPVAAPARGLDEELGADRWVEVAEVKIDLLGTEASITTRPLPPIHFASAAATPNPEAASHPTASSAPPANAVPSPSAILSHLTLVDFATAGAIELGQDELSPDRPIGLVLAFAEPCHSSSFSRPRPSTDLHLWKVEKQPVELHEAFFTQEVKSPLAPNFIPPIAEWIAMHAVRRSLGEGRVLIELGQVGPASAGLGLATILGGEGGMSSSSPASLQVGEFAVLDLATLQDAPGWSRTSLLRPRTTALAPKKRRGSQQQQQATPSQSKKVPSSSVSSPNGALLASLSDVVEEGGRPGIVLQAHPLRSVNASDITDDTDRERLARELGTALALSLHQGTDSSDVIRLALDASGLKKQTVELAAFADIVLERTWAVLRAQEEGPTGSSPPTLGDSEWLLPVLGVQLILYRAIQDPRWKLASDVLALAASNALFLESRPSGTTFLPESIWKLVPHTVWVLGVVSGILRRAVVDQAWYDWKGSSLTENKDTPPSRSAASSSLLLIHPTTRSLLHSLLDQITDFSAFLTQAAKTASTASSPSSSAASLLSTQVPAASAALESALARSGLNVVRLGKELELLEGVLSTDGGASSDQLDSPLVRLKLEPPSVSSLSTEGNSNDDVDPARRLAASVAKLPKETLSKVLLLLRAEAAEADGAGDDLGGRKRKAEEEP